MKRKRESNNDIINQDDDNISTNGNALDVSIKKPRNEKAVELVSRCGELALHASIEIGNTEIAKLLIDTAFSIDSSIARSLLTDKAKNDFTALHVAVHYGNIEIAKLLIDTASFIDSTFSHSLLIAKLNDGFTALHVAVQHGNTEIAKLLIDTAFSIDSSIAHSLLTAKTKNGFTALHVAVHYGNIEIAKLLIDTDSSTDSSITHSLLTAKANNGVTALQYARQNRKIEATKFLNEVTELQTSILKLFKPGYVYQDYKKLSKAFINNSFAKNVFIKALSSKVNEAIVEGIETTQRLLTLIHRNIKEAKLFESQSDMIKEIFENSILCELGLVRSYDDFLKSSMVSLKFTVAMKITKKHADSVLDNDIKNKLTKELEIYIEYVAKIMYKIIHDQGNDLTSNYGKLALHQAIKDGKNQAAKWLIEKASSLDPSLLAFKTKYGKTALDLARDTKDKHTNDDNYGSEYKEILEIIELLEKYEKGVALTQVTDDKVKEESDNMVEDIKKDAEQIQGTGTESTLNIDSKASSNHNSQNKIKDNNGGVTMAIDKTAMNMTGDNPQLDSTQLISDNIDINLMGND